MQDAPRQDWGIGTSKAHIAIMRAAPPGDLSVLARSYDWAAHPVPVLGWVMAQKSVDLGTAITVFFQGGPERFNYLPKKSVPRCHAPVVRLLDNICLRINCGFYLPHPDGAPAEAAHLVCWMAAQKADRAEGLCGRWVPDEEVLARVAPIVCRPQRQARRRRRLWHRAQNGTLKRFAFNLRHQVNAKRAQRLYVARVSRKSVIQIFRETL